VQSNNRYSLLYQKHNAHFEVKGFVVLFADDVKQLHLWYHLAVYSQHQNKWGI